MPSIITSIGTANPPNKVSQQQVAEFMLRHLDLSPQKAKWLKKVYDASGIAYRYTVIPDYLKDQGAYHFYPNNQELQPFPRINTRMDLYKEHALSLASDAIQNCIHQHQINANEVTHLITVSCTGMHAPGLDIELVRSLELADNIERTAIQYMGCYAVFNGFKVADHICQANPDAKVLLVSVELCTIHFQNGTDKDQIVANALFSDGAAAAMIEGNGQTRTGLKLQQFTNKLIPEGQAHMTWSIGNFGFEMRLSNQVPQMLQGHLKPILDELSQNGQFHKPDLYAIHPGGRKILEFAEEELAIEPSKNAYAKEILKNYGNMSSPTILFVLEKILANRTGQDDGKQLLALAFGPGLTLEAGRFQISNENS